MLGIILQQISELIDRGEIVGYDDLEIFAIISSIDTILFDSKKQLRILEFEIARGLFVPAVFRYLGLPDSKMAYASARHDPDARFR